MKRFARETRLSETSFVQSATEAGADYRHRIFMPTGEVPFAGHPSLGTAVAVARARGERAATYVQQTPAGLQPIDVEVDGDAPAPRCCRSRRSSATSSTPRTCWARSGLEGARGAPRPAAAVRRRPGSTS